MRRLLLNVLLATEFEQVRHTDGRNLACSLLRIMWNEFRASFSLQLRNIAKYSKTIRLFLSFSYFFRRC